MLSDCPKKMKFDRYFEQFEWGWMWYVMTKCRLVWIPKNAIINNCSPLGKKHTEQSPPKWPSFDSKTINTRLCSKKIYIHRIFFIQTTVDFQLSTDTVNLSHFCPCLFSRKLSRISTTSHDANKISRQPNLQLHLKCIWPSIYLNMYMYTNCRVHSSLEFNSIIRKYGRNAARV